LKPGTGYEPHSDYYDVMLILLDGKIRTLKKALESNSVIFYQAGESHGIKNIGSKIAQYIIFEFHRHEYFLGTLMNVKRIFKFIYKRIMPKKMRSLIFKVKRRYILY